MAACGRMRRAGVTVGMSVARAAEVVGHVGSNGSGSPPNSLLPGSSPSDPPPVQIEQHDPGADLDALDRLAAAIADQISPLVAVEQLDEKPWAGHWRHQSESLLVDITGVTHLFAGEDRLCDRVVQICRSMYLRCRQGVADTPAVAWGLAHYGHPPPPAAAVVLPPGHGIAATLPVRNEDSNHDAGGGDESTGGETTGGGPTGNETLLDFPVEALRIDEPTTVTLSRLGVTTVGQCLRLPRDGLASRLGRGLVRQLDYWTGDRHESITIHDLPVEFAERWDLQYPTDDLQIIGDRMGRLVDRLIGGLTVAGVGAMRLAVRLDLIGAVPLAFDVGLFAPSRDGRHIHELLMHHVDGNAAAGVQLPVARRGRRRVVDHRDGKVTAIHLSVVASGAMRTEQTTLFETGAVDAAGTWRNDPVVARLIDALACRVGRGEVVEILPSPDPIPESSFAPVPLAGNLRRIGQSNQSSRSRRRRRHPSGRTAGPRRSPPVSRGRNSDPVLDERPQTRPGRFGPQISDAMRRPLVLLDRPMPLVVDGLQERSLPPQTESQIASDDWLGQVPPRIRIAGVFERITRAWGPERIESDWWKGRPVCRDYYRVETQRGQWLWVFRDDAGQWFVQGRFC